MPVPGYSRAAVQALEDQEDALDVLRLDTDAVVAHARKANHSPGARPPTSIADRFIAAELDRVADQVLEELYQLRFIGHDRRQGISDDDGPALLDGRTQVRTSVLSTAARNRCGANSLPACRRANSSADR